MSLDRFRQHMRVLLNIDRDELEAAGVIAKGNGEEWQRFRSGPFLFFLRADQVVAGRLWSIVERRMSA